ncbi:hypothetical protein H4219_000774 [Mycoemilia scoparia]|uniref:peptide-methionine (S)-S-oxide reductase n=1 Tax=Mycoemilia scoparia TaxID=417184 RepID=A0A9W8A224_9FUNG|nr:hypothetical protein H4219_000774 [Mycoemilia scoparia]
MSSNSFPSAIKKSSPSTEQATFAAGCFWSVELAFQRINGVLQTQVGYTGGDVKDPNYRNVCSGTTNHAESVLIEYDPKVVKYSDLLNAFWNKHDPTQGNRQGNDVGSQYRSAIFYHSPEQKAEAEASKKSVASKLGKTVTTQIAEASTFYPAEEYHQRYLEKGGQCAAKGCKDRIMCYGI